MTDVSSQAYERFLASMVIDFEKWHDGLGYDLGQLALLTEADRLRLAKQLASRTPLDWRNIEALAAIAGAGSGESPELIDATSCSIASAGVSGSSAAEFARSVLRGIADSGDSNGTLALLQFSPHSVSSDQKTDALVHALRTARFYDGLTQAIDEAAEFHPPEVVKTLFEGALRREKEVAVHFAALLFYIYGKAAEPFDWAHRPFFLSFATEIASEREAAFCELCRQLQVDPSLFL